MPVSSRLIHVVAGVRICFQGQATSHRTYIIPLLPVHSSPDRRLGCFRLPAAEIMGVSIPGVDDTLTIFSKYPVVKYPHGKSVLSFLRSRRTVFHSDGIFLGSTATCNPRECLFLGFDSSRHLLGVTRWHVQFQFAVPSLLTSDTEHLFPVLTGRACVFSGESSLQIFGPFFS